MGICCCVTVGWIHSIYFYLHSFLRSTAEFSEITHTRRRGATVTIHTGRRRGGHMVRHGQTALNIIPVLYTYLYIFPYFLYILNICLNVVIFCSKIRGLLWLCGGGGGQSIYWNDVFTFLKVMYLA